MAQGIYHKPAFNWWVETVLNKSLRIISLFNKRKDQYLKKTHNFGIEVPKSVGQAYFLYNKNKNNL